MSDATAGPLDPESPEQMRRQTLTRSKPDALGVSPSAVQAFVQGVNEKFGGLHSFMLLRHGKVAAEGWWAPYGPRDPHMLFSLSKSFTSTGVGLAQAEGLLSIDDLVLPYFPKEAPASPDGNLKAMRIRHLLCMGTGHDKDASGGATGDPDGNWAKGFLSLPVEHKPGTHFAYNSAATYMLSAIVQKVSGKRLVDYLTPRLFEPLGIEGMTWETCPRGINCGGWGLSVKTEDIARFGQLYLQMGQWKGKQIIPAAWVQEATTQHISNGDPSTPSDWAQGYGYQFWRCRHGAYRGDGAFGQYCLVMPDKDAVLAITSGLGDMQAVLNLVWERLLPGMESGAFREPEPAAQLKQQLADLSLAYVQGQVASAAGEEASGKTFTFAGNDQKIQSITPTFKGGRCTLKVRDDRMEHKLEVDHERWLKGRTTLGSGHPQKVAASGGWTDADTYVIKMAFYETPFCPTITCRFKGKEMTYQYKNNVGFGPTEAPELTGKLS
jgi:CubicO group peptidase (beta-lactamase class C family)